MVSWHARWGREDPFQVPLVVGSTIGAWTVLGLAYKHPHWGLVASVRCRCGAEAQRVATKLRHAQKRAARLGRKIGCRSCARSVRQEAA